MPPSGFMMDARRLTKTALDVHGRLQVRLQQQENNTWVGFIEDPRLNQKDDIGALYYVIAVIFIYGLSIVMMIASHIRKNKQDCQLRAYLKEMAVLRKADRREKLLGRITSIANATPVKDAMRSDDKDRGGNGGGGGGWRNLVRMGSKGSRNGSRQGSLKNPRSPEAGGGRGETGGDDGSRHALINKKGSTGSGMASGNNSPRLHPGEEEDETGDSDFLPVDFALEMNRLTPSVTPLTSPSATPSPPPRHTLKSSLKSKRNVPDDSFVL